MKSIWQNRQTCSSRCDSCPGCDAPYPLHGLGDVHADIMLVGQEPAYNVDNDTVDMEMSWYDAKATLEENRRESMNPLWQHMMNVAVAAECAPTDLYFTNLVKCDDSDSDWQTRFEHCGSYLCREVAQVDPEVLLLYGSKVIQGVFDMFGLDVPDAVGPVHATTAEASSLTLIPLYHWGYAYRRNNVDEYNEQVREAVKTVT